MGAVGGGCLQGHRGMPQPIGFALVYQNPWLDGPRCLLFSLSFNLVVSLIFYSTMTPLLSLYTEGGQNRDDSSLGY